MIIENMQYTLRRPLSLTDLQERSDDQRRHPVEKIIGGKRKDKRICIITCIIGLPESDPGQFFLCSLFLLRTREEPEIMASFQISGGSFHGADIRCRTDVSCVCSRKNIINRGGTDPVFIRA